MEIDPKIIALISAGSAIFGAVVTQIFSFFQKFLDRKYKRNILLREKYEELGVHIVNSEEWLRETIKQKKPLDVAKYPSQAKLALTLSFIYFPELTKSIDQYLNSLVDVQTAVMNKYPRYKDKPTLNADIEKAKTTFKNSLNVCQAARLELENDIKKYAKKYARA